MEESCVTYCMIQAPIAIHVGNPTAQLYLALNGPLQGHFNFEWLICTLHQGPYILSLVTHISAGSLLI